MLFSKVFMLALGFAEISTCVSVPQRSEYRSVSALRRLEGRQKQAATGTGKGDNCVPANLIQSASAKTGQEPGTDGLKPGQAPSDTDNNNFVNFCTGQKITNGVQVTGGSCNGIPMGQIPATKNMVAAMITFPLIGDEVAANQTFNISVQTAHLDAGFFVNPTTNYYTAPQALNKDGDIIGHCHVTIQSIGSLRDTTPPDPAKFAFFKGIDDAGNGKGLLQAQIADGLPAGAYRACTMMSARNHQPVLMPVAQRGAQDDCVKFEVKEDGNDGKAGGDAAAGKGKGGNAAGGKGNAGKGNGGAKNAGDANVGKMESGKVDGKAKDQKK
ncbi:hypothetical protein HYFRA_00004325 [Hymenoscyphus fraxineus]|uniref:Ribosomal protein s17 n=1 Tax=Hymenoscyphus fraxineus TaxID=746836 RepID=A0A9N9KNP2_9HELO|nr:hypothetical protein HYFRA_00004325 [Hymenoscyphus fraxineus]